MFEIRFSQGKYLLVVHSKIAQVGGGEQLATLVDWLEMSRINWDTGQ